MTIAFVVLLIIAVAPWTGVIANLVSHKSTDAAGRGWAEAFAIILSIVLWILLSVLMILAAVHGSMPIWSRVAALVLVPGSCVSAIGAIQLFCQYRQNNERWPIAIPVAMPVLIASHATATYFSKPADSIAVAIWIVVLILSILPWPFFLARSKKDRAAGRRAFEDYQAEQRAQEEKRLNELFARFEKLPKETPLWDWRPFVDSTDPSLRARALAGIQTLERRQADAERMIRDGLVFPVVELPNLHLAPTASLQEHAKNFLANVASRFADHQPERTYDEVGAHVESYLSAMKWLIENGTNIAPERAALIKAVETYESSERRDQFLNSLKNLSQTTADAK